MSAPSPGTSTRFRLARIAGLVLGSLVFLHACERSKSALLSDVRMEVAVAAAFAAAALGAAWFEIKLRGPEQDADPPWDDADEDETPSPGNFPGRAGRSAEPVYGRSERPGRTGIGPRSAPPDHWEDDDLPDAAESPGWADLVAGIARTLRITRAHIADRQPLLPLGAVTKWMRRVDPDDEIGAPELDDDDQTEQITRTETGELVIESGVRTVRAKISRSGDLVLHGRRHAEARSEWKWTFPTEAFPAIRAALGDGPGDLLDLLEDTLPWLDAVARHDPGAWLRAHDIAATYQEKGVSATQITRELPVLQPGRPPQPPRASRSRRKPPQEARGESRSTRRGAAEPPTSSRRTDADRPTRTANSWPTARTNPPAGDYSPPAAARRRRREESEPARRGDRLPRGGGANPPPRSAPGRLDPPRRRRPDEPDASHRAGPRDDYDDAEVRHPRGSEQTGRRPADREPGTGRRERPDAAYRDRPVPSDRDRADDQPPGRRHRGDQRSRREPSLPPHESARRGW
ncbi:hypothetical protein U3653_12150 [Nocardia sp. CDC186]|uniref:Translation initiation factor IF-2 n=1 Tax=Nocardia implantans TaxID=3108168 RepID=A0ABU6ATZ8_9NOCA|nr:MULTISPECIES: hypothetical protein [unclassified Nocardia]MBF6191109.1 hypothetical protein [Nocardia beijingensis]MEA3529107.1 hypothetical protein [Nocardia sp. CDC192]MEB3510772.1 hypothetical protein [Nocardia sp. CDC186]